MASSDDDPAQRANMEADNSTHQEQIPRPSWYGDIPNSSVREMVRRREELAGNEVTATTICVPEWVGYYQIESEYDAFERIHPFLAFGDLPPELLPTSKPAYHIVACAGSLLLFKLDSTLQQPPPVAQTSTGLQAVVGGRRRGRSKLRSPHADHSERSESSTSQDQIICPSCATWETLFVCNPATSERKELPKPSCADVGFASWDYCGGVQADMVARGDNYKIILTFSNWLLVYKSPDKSTSTSAASASTSASSSLSASTFASTSTSTCTSASNGWRCLRFPEPASWGRDIDGRVVESPGTPWGWVSACAFVGGRLYFTDVIPEPDTGYAKYTLHLFKIDEEAGTWKLHNSYSLRKRLWNFLSTDRYSSLGRELDVIRSVEIVECMGKTYAVVPTRIDEHLTTEFTTVRTLEELLQHPVEGFDFLPVQFHILRLERGDHVDVDTSFGHPVLRIVVPKNYADPAGIHEPDLLETFRERRPRLRNWFWVAALGSVIFVACHSYLLQCDVVSGESKTGIIRELALVVVPHMIYSPDVHISCL